jgi:hypothetical protein
MDTSRWIQSTAVRIAFATTTPAVLEHDNDLDRGRHEMAFADAGVDLEYCVWWDDRVRWHDYDLVVIRSTWDYVERLDEFRAWVARVGALGRLRNPAGVVGWNLDKRYLLDLQAEGLPVIPTRIVSRGSDIEQALTSTGGEVIVKPVISAGSRNTGRFAHDDPLALALAEKILAEGTAAMIQPCVSSVTTMGETGAVLFDGAVSHSFRKGAILALGGGFLDGRYAEEVESTTLTHQQRQVVETTAGVLARMVAERFAVRSSLLYARVDMVTLDDGRDVVLEVELAEPSFFLDIDSGAADRFVAAVTEHAARAA